MTHTAELLPCAHCGCEDVAIIPAAVPNGRIRFRPQCGDDGCRASLALYGTEAEAITAWNTRAGIPDPAQLRADRDALLGALANAKWLLEGIKRAGWVTKPSYGDEINLGLERINTLISRICGEVE